MKQKPAATTYRYRNNLYINVTNESPNRGGHYLDDIPVRERLIYQGHEPDREEILSDLRRRDLLAYKEIVFGGYGEPACRWDDVLWLCDRLREMGPYFLRLNTTGLGDLINRRDIAYDLEDRFDSVSVELIASTPAQYHDICDSIYGQEALPAVIRFTAMAVLEVPFVRMMVNGNLPKSELSACRRICDRIGADFELRSL